MPTKIIAAFAIALVSILSVHAHPDVRYPLEIKPVYREEKSSSGTAELTKDDYPLSLEYILPIGTRFINVNLTKNKDLFGDLYEINGQKANQTNCYYHGNVVGMERTSSAVMSLCYGMDGVLQINDMQFYIRPRDAFNNTRLVDPRKMNNVLHVLNRMNYTEFIPEKSGSGERRSYLISPLTTPNGVVEQRSYLNSPLMTPIGLVQKRTVSMIIYNDKARTNLYGAKTEHSTASVMNYVSNFFKQSPLNAELQVTLAGQVSWREGDLVPALQSITNFQTPVNSERLLEQFIEFTHTTDARQGVKPLPSHSHRQLYTNRMFAGNAIGYAPVGYSCTTQSASICEMNRASDFLNAITSAHELLHELNAYHDGAGSTCPEYGFIMSPIAGYSSQFSQCTIRAVEAYLNTPFARLCIVPDNA